MRILLDVNALITWGHPSTDQHDRLHAWRQAHAADTLCSCAITELGFLRISMSTFGATAEQAQRELAKLKVDLEFLSALPAPKLPGWCQTHRQTTDAYLLQLAEHHGTQLATFDTGIPGVLVI